MHAIALVDQTEFVPGGFTVTVRLPDGATIDIPPVGPRFGFGGTIAERLARAGWGATGAWQPTDREKVLQVGVEPQPNARENRALLVQHRA